MYFSVCKRVSFETKVEASILFLSLWWGKNHLEGWKIYFRWSWALLSKCLLHWLVSTYWVLGIYPDTQVHRPFTPIYTKSCYSNSNLWLYLLLFCNFNSNVANFTKTFGQLCIVYFLALVSPENSIKSVHIFLTFQKWFVKVCGHVGPCIFLLPTTTHEVDILQTWAAILGIHNVEI